TVVQCMSPLRASLLAPDRMREALSLAVFSYSSTGKPNVVSPVTNAVQGSVTVTTVTCAPSCLARSKPAATALPASSDPSVAIRMCLYMVSSGVWSGGIGWHDWHRSEAHCPARTDVAGIELAASLAIVEYSVP